MAIDWDRISDNNDEWYHRMIDDGYNEEDLEERDGDYDWNI